MIVLPDFYVGENIYFEFQLVKPSDGVTPINADVMPSAIIVKNGSVTVDSSTISSLSGITGGYSVSYNPAAETESDSYIFRLYAQITDSAYNSGLAVSHNAFYATKCRAYERGVNASGFPTNFSLINIDSSGKILLQPNQSGVTIPTVTTLTNSPSGVALTTDITSARNTITALLPAVLVSGKMDVSVGAYQVGLAPLQPTVAGRTIDISVSGEAGIDLANVGSPTTTLNLSGTTIGTVTSAVTLPTIPVNWITDSGIASSAISEIQSGVALQTTLSNLVSVIGTPSGDSVSIDIANVRNNLITQSGVRSAVGLSSANLDSQFSDISGKLPSGLVNGSIRAYVYEIANDAINVAATDANLVTWIQEDLATTSEVNSVRTLVSGIPNSVINFNLPESYSDSGIEPTLAQALYMIQQSVTQFDITGTVISVKKLDGTEAATYSLNSATAPTSRRRS